MKSGIPEVTADHNNAVDAYFDHLDKCEACTAKALCPTGLDLSEKLFDTEKAVLAETRRLLSVNHTGA